MRNIEDYPLDSIILYSLREFSNGNIDTANKIHNLFQKKVKSSLKKAQQYSKDGNDLKADIILSNITKAKIAQSEWIYIATQKNVEKKLQIDVQEDSFLFFDDIYKNLKKSDQDFKEQQYQILNKTFSDGNFKQTEIRSKQLLLIFPKDIKFQKFFGKSQIMLGKQIQAIKTFENSLKFNPNNSELLFQMAIAQAKSGFKVHTELFLRKSLVHNKNNFDANKFLGELLVEQKNFVEAEFYLKKASKLKKDISSINADLSKCLLQQKKYKGALKYCRLACKSSPDNYKYFNNMGVIYKALNNFSEAEVSFRIAINIFPEFYEAHNNLGNVIQKSKPYQAIYHYKIAENDKNILDIVYLNLSLVFRQLKNNSEALKYIKKSIKINPNLLISLKTTALIYFDNGNFKKSIKFFKRILQLSPFEGEIYRLLGKLELLDQTVITEVEQSLKQNKFDKDHQKHIFFMLGEYYEKIENFKKSWHYYQKANLKISKIVSYDIKKDQENFLKIKDYFNKIKKENTYSNYSDVKIIFIIGMPRSGTTLVEQILASNSDLYPAGEISLIPSHMDNLLKNINNINNLDLLENLYNLKELYFNSMSNITNKKMVIDKMPYNFQYLGILRHIFPNSVFINVYRSEMDNCFSIYKNYFSNNTHSYAYSLGNIFSYFKLYKEYLKYWRCDELNYVYKIKYNNLILKPEFEIKKLLDFLGFEWNNSYNNFHKNKRAIYTSSASQVRKKIYNTSVNKWEKYSKYINILK